MLTAITPQTVDLRRLTEAQARGIGELIAEVWPKAAVTAADRAEQFAALGRNVSFPDNQAPRSFVIFELGRVIAHACIFPRQISTDSGEMVIAALARVCTDPPYRGRGLGERVVQAALRTATGDGFPFALFQTNPSVQPFYERLGCVEVKNRIVNSLADDPDANPFWDEVAMRYPAHGDWPAGTIDLRGAGY